MSRTIVHLMRHGEVHNPEGVLYGRLPNYRLSELGHRMAERVAEHLSGALGEPRRDVVAVIASPLERAQQTATPVAAAFGVELGTDDRIIEAANHFEGFTFGKGKGRLTNPQHWPHLWNPFRPSWGEPYQEQVDRVMQAVHAARELAEGHEAVLVSHQLPIWATRLAAEGRRLWHDPRQRECTLASLTSFTFRDDTLTGVSYREPARDLLPAKPGVSGA
ncbi:histidine phosphatase family protein [Micrococcales bacterium 31B]|nr:histidine phosphatase family protein [Micrococcales bacterium 31B]